MHKHPAFIGIFVVVSVLTAGLIFADGTVVRGAIANGAYKTLTDLGGVIGAIVALIAAAIAYMATLHVKEVASREEAIARLRAYAAVLVQIEYAYNDAVWAADVPLNTPGRVEKLDALESIRRSPDFLGMRFDPIMSGEGAASNFFSNTLVFAVNPDRLDRDRDRDIVSTMMWELRASINRRIRAIEDGEKISHVRKMNVVGMEKYGRLLTKGTPINPNDINYQ